MSKYELLFIEENISNFELNPALLHYIKAQDLYRLGVKSAVFVGKGHLAQFYLHEDEIMELQDKTYQFFSKKKNFNVIVKNVNQTIKNTRRYTKQFVSTNLRKFSDKKLWEFYDDYSFKKIYPIFMYYSLLEAQRFAKLETELKNFLKKKKVKDISQRISVLTTAPIKTKMVIEGTFLDQSFQEGLQKEDVKIDMNLINKKIGIEEKIDLKEKNQLLKKLNPPPKIKHFINVLSILGEERIKIRLTFMKVLYYSELFLIEFKRRFNVLKKELRLYDYQELKDLLTKNVKLTKKQLQLRKKGLVKILTQGDIETFEGVKAQKFISELSQKPQNVKEFVGDTASKGKVVGKVALFTYQKAGQHLKKIQRMKPGDIVVTEMTRPNIISACEKAGAIITDEGGVLCHAAIVSRELQVPCVIGTKIATASLKDGDLVEVDATKGLVKKISLREYNKKRQVTKKKKKRKIKEIKLDVNKVKKGNIFWFKQLNKKDIPTAGGKGANLGELSRFVKVPNGFCISSYCYKQFLETNNISNMIKQLTKKINLDNQEQLDQIAKQIQRLILKQPFVKELEREIILNYNRLKNKKVAVRSSATAEDLPTASFAGQQDTYLNIKGEKNLINAVHKCWASLFTPRAIHYREKNNFDHVSVLISVVVQEMIKPKYSGVMFTKDPLDLNDILIEVVKGLGEKLVSGETTPSSYLIDRSKNIVVKKKELFRMDNKIIFRLAELGRIIEKHYAHPQDIEWAIDTNNVIYTLQSRAITTL